ncbi:MAG: hypothetical protein IJS44_02185 [Clostridia bacterium]|nr:hypothetical protein [Clostridia bacterium]
MNAYRMDSYPKTFGRKKYRTPAAVRLLRAIVSVTAERLHAHADTIRAASVLTSLFVILGIVGAMECGGLSFAVGIPVCALISLFALRAHFED